MKAETNMKAESKFYVQSLFYDCLTNGLKDDINNNPERLGFILGALDNGFTMINSSTAKKGLITIYLRHRRDDEGLNVIIFKKNERQCEFMYSSEAFMWHKTKLHKGRFLISLDDNDKYEFICSTT